jgi:hypothetical protein
VKDIIRLPIFFLFVFILLFILFFGLSVLAYWGIVHSEGREAALQAVEAGFPGLLVQVLPASVFAALFVLMAHIAAKPGSRFLSLLIPLAGAFVILAVGYQILQRLEPADRQTAGVSRAESVEASSRRYLVPEVFNSAESKVIYLEQIGEPTVSPVVLVEGGNADRKLLYFPRGFVVVGDDAVVLRMGMAGTDRYTLEIDPQPVYGAMFDEGPVLKRLFSDVDFLNRELLRVFRSSLPEFYFAVLALVVAFYGSGMFLRLSRWHLLNITLALLALRGLLALFCFLGEGAFFELSKDMSNPQALKFLPEVVLFVVGGLLVLIDLLFVPFKRGERV